MKKFLKDFYNCFIDMTVVGVLLTMSVRIIKKWL